jgi:hypothetical protein
LTQIKQSDCRLPAAGVSLQNNSLEAENNLDSQQGEGYKDYQKGSV